MNEIRKYQIIQLEDGEGLKVDGTVLDFEKDRIAVLVDDNSTVDAIKLRELDLLKASVHSLYGIKIMKTHVISELDGRNCILIENNEAEYVEQKREHVRVVDNFDFNVLCENRLLKAKSINISGGGIAFRCGSSDLIVADKVVIIFDESIFSRVIKIKAEIIKAHDDFFVAKYENLNEYDESKIVQRIFKLLAQK